MISKSKRTIPNGDLRAAIDRISGTYHAALLGQLLRLERIMSNVAAGYGLSYFQLQPLAELFVELEDKLRAHVEEQNQHLFPMLRQVVSGKETNAAAITKLIGLFKDCKHADKRVARLFRKISRLTGDYHSSTQSCAAYQEIIRALRQLDEQTREHFQAEAELVSRLEQASV